MKRKIFLYGILSVAFLYLTYVNGIAQTLNDAVNEYNEAARLLNTDPEAAIIHFEKAIEIAGQLGDEGLDTKEKAQAGLALVPGIYFRQAMDYYKAKDFDSAIRAFEKTVETGEKYNDSETGRKAQAAIPQLYWAKGNDQLRDGDYTGAIANYDKAIELNPNYGRAYLNRGLAYKELDDLENMKASLDKAIELSVGRDEKTVTTAEERIRISYYNEGVMALQKQEWDKAEAAFNVSIEYGNNDPDIYLKLGEINNELGNFDKAIQYLNQGIGLVDGDGVAKAGFYYHMGNSYKSLSDTEKACDSYKKAMFGDYLANAKYQVETVLKCQ